MVKPRSESTRREAPPDIGPRYLRVQRALEERVASGLYPVGGLLPTEAALAAEFDTSRFTVREALRHLTERGLVKRRQGVGTRVIARDPRAHYVQSFESLHELFQVAADTWYVMHETRQVRLSEDEVARVGGRAGQEWLVVDGVRWTEPGGRPICFIRSYVPSAYHHVVATFEGLQGPFFAALEPHAPGPIEEVVQEIRALPMPPAIGRSLGLAPGAWSLQLLRRYLTRGGVLIASFNWHPAEQLTYTMRIQRGRRLEGAG